MPELTEAALIDAANDAPVLLDLIERFAPKLTLIVTTHQHGDHWQALAEVVAATGAPTAGRRTVALACAPVESVTCRANSTLPAPSRRTVALLALLPDSMRARPAPSATRHW